MLLTHTYICVVYVCSIMARSIFDKLVVNSFYFSLFKLIPLIRYFSQRNIYQKNCDKFRYDIGGQF